MKNSILIIMIFCCVIVIFCCAACIHDLKVMKAYNNSIQEQLGQIAMEQAEQSKEIRVMKTNNDIVFDLVIKNDWESEK